MADDIDFGADMKLNQFQNDFFKNMNTFRKDGMFCDVTLLVNGTRFKCHRLILSMASPYFQTMFNGDFKESKLDVVTIEEIETDIMDQILNAVYTAQLQLLPENVYFVLKASHFLQISAIVDKCVACIVKNTRINYLIETCLLAKSLDLKNLYDVCLHAIANDLKRWGRTEAIRKLPFDVFSSILSNGNFTQIEDEVFLLLIKWSKYTNATSTEIRRLLELSTLKGPIISPTIVAELISSIDNSCALVKNGNHEDNVKLDSTLRFNVYLNVVDEETGAVGCGLLKLNDNFEFDRFPTLYNFQKVSSLFATKICKADSKIYSLESDNVAKKYTFFCWEDFENDKKVELQIPNDIPWCESCDIVPIGNVICFLTKIHNSHFWGYDPQHNTWRKVFEQEESVGNNRNGGKRSSLYNYFSDWLAVTVLGNVLYIIGVNYSNRVIVSFDSRTPTSRKVINFPDSFDHEYVAVCTFDGKIAISGSKYGSVSRNIFYIYDANTNKWLTDIKPMNNGQANRKLVYRDGFIYALGNSPIVANEKYDVNSNIWSNIPSLPKRLLVKNNREMVVSTGYVVYVD